MATKIGPKTVTQRDRSKNLVFCVDAAHGDSYGGQPFTQQIGSLPADATVGSATWTNADFGHGLVGGKWHQEDTSDVLVRSLVTDTWGPSSGDVVTLSYYAWTDVSKSGYLKSQIWVDVDGTRNWLQTDGSWSTSTNEYYLLIKPTQSNGEWHRVSKTITFPSGTLTNFEWGGFYRYTDYFNLYIANLQLEIGSVATRYSSTTRNASNSVKNISGVGAQGTTLTGTFATYGQQLHKPFPAGQRSAASLGAINQPRVRNVNATVDPKKGHIGGAYWDFDGSDETIDCGDIDALEIQYMTIAAWINPDATTADDYVMSTKQAGGFSMGINIGSIAANKITTRSWAAGTYNNLAGTSDIPIGEWTYVVTTYDGSNFRIYVNGEQENSSAAAGTLDYTAGNLFIGAESGGAVPSGGYFNGKIATAMIWSVALTAKEIKDIYIAQKGRFGK